MIRFSRKPEDAFQPFIIEIHIETRRDADVLRNFFHRARKGEKAIYEGGIYDSIITSILNILPPPSEEK